MKMAAPGLSCQAFLKMLDQRTVRFGRMGKISADSFQKSFFEWEAVRYDNILKVDPFTCHACTPDMLAISVDGNHKHYRFKNAAKSEEQAIFEDIFIAKDEDVAGFVDYIHNTSRHVSGRGVCGGEWSAARETSQRSSSKMDEEGLELAVCRHGVLLSALNMYRGEIFAYPLYLQQKLTNQQITFFCMDVTCKCWPYPERVTKSCPELQHLLNMRPFLSVFHAKAHDFKCEVKWSGAYQDGAGLTLGEEVEQCNAFLSRIAVTTKHMSKAAAATTSTGDADASVSRIEVLVASIKRRCQRLYKETDGNKARAKIRRKIREEKGILTSAVEKYNRMVPDTETLHLEEILCGDTARPWQRPHSDSVSLRTKRRAFEVIMAVKRLEEEKKILVREMDHHWKSLSAHDHTLKELYCLLSSDTVKSLSCGLSEEGVNGLQSIILRKRENVRQVKLHARECYLQALSGPLIVLQMMSSIVTLNFLMTVSSQHLKYVCLHTSIHFKLSGCTAGDPGRYRHASPTNVLLDKFFPPYIFLLI